MNMETIVACIQYTQSVLEEDCQVYLYLSNPLIMPLNKLDNYIYFTARCHACDSEKCWIYQDSMLSVLVIFFS